MSGRIISTILETGRDMQKLGNHPPFLPFMVSFVTAIAPVGVSVITSILMYYNEHIMRSRSTKS